MRSENLFCMLCRCVTQCDVFDSDGTKRRCTVCGWRSAALMDERSDWFVTWTGRRIFLRTPRIEDIYIEDIAHALSHVCRFGGHVTRFYSVAQHSAHVSMLVPPELALAGLLHDASEAYLGDVIRPLKRQLGRAYGELEDRFGEVIAARFGVNLDAPEIKEADMDALMYERADLQPEATRRALAGEWRWIEDEQRRTPRHAVGCPVPLNPEAAKELFLVRFAELGGQ